MKHEDEDTIEGELEDTEEQEEQEEEETELVWESLALKEFPVKIKEGRDAGDYVLVETTAEDARKWRANNLQSLTSLEKGKGKKRESTVTFLESLASSQLLLVSLCLYKIAPNGVRTRVSRETIKTWPNEFVRQLFVKAQEISALRDLEEEDEDDEDGGGPDLGNSSQQKRIRGAR